MIDEELLAILACPGCQGALELKKSDKANSLICTRCKHIYPIVDGIPVLLVEKTEL